MEKIYANSVKELFQKLQRASETKSDIEKLKILTDYEEPNKDQHGISND